MEIVRHSGDLHLVVVDMMMPRGETFSEEITLGGLRTGEVLCSTIHKLRPELPIVILTVLEERPHGKALEGVAAWVCKGNALPFEFAEIVKSLLQKK